MYICKTTNYKYHMAIVNRQEFCELCNITNGNLSNYILRKNVFISENGTIDTLTEPNKTFISKRKARIAGEVYEKPIKEKPLKIEKKELREKTIAEPSELVVENKTQKARIKSDELDDWTALEKKHKQLQIQKGIEELELLKIKKEKLLGDVLPLDILKPLISQHSKSITVEFKQASDNILVRFAKKKDLTRQEISDLRSEMIDVINEAVEKSISNTKSMIKNIVDEYSQSKERYERS